MPLPSIPATGDLVERQRIVVGSRKSKLALIQTEWVISELKKYHPEKEFVIKTMDTTGDNIQNIPLAKIGEKALFTKELEFELQAGMIDIVVHSLKDLPTTLRKNCCIAAITEREDPSDALVFRQGVSVTGETLPEIVDKLSVIGTSSLRRIAQLKALQTRAITRDVRGNLNTRFSKLDNFSEYGFDCLILASAGLKRGGLENRISFRLDWYHAVSQGALGIECRTNDIFIINQILHPLIHERTMFECLAERSFLKYLEGGCSVPIGVRSKWIDLYTLKLEGIVLSLDGSQSFQSSILANLNEESDNYNDPTLPDLTDIIFCRNDNTMRLRLKNCATMGTSLAKDLLNKGAGNVLETIRKEMAISKQ